MESRSTKAGETTDELGRARFHGAFSGGFSAGYFNSVGSKEGWTPQQFSSSRSKRADIKAQSLTDFQDAEDQEAELMEGKQLTTNQEFSSFHDARRHTGGVAENLLRDDADLDHSQDSVGWRLLKQMGWTAGEGVGAKRVKRKIRPLEAAVPAVPAVVAVAVSTAVVAEKAGKHTFVSKKKVYGVTLPQGGVQAIHAKAEAEAQETAQAAMTKRIEHSAERLCRTSVKRDTHGLGYDRFGEAPEFEDLAAIRQKQKAAAVALDIQEHHEGKGKQGAAFGLGALEDADRYDDCYETSSMKEYDREAFTEKEVAREKEAHRATPSADVRAVAGGPMVTKKGVRGLWSRFHVSQQLQKKKKVYPPPKLPPGWEPFHRFDKEGEAPGSGEVREQLIDVRLGVGAHGGGLRMNHHGRAAILGESPLPNLMPPPPPPMPPPPPLPVEPSSMEGFHPSATLLQNGALPEFVLRMPGDQLKKIQFAAKAITKQGSEAYVPYPREPPKHERYCQFLRDMAGLEPEGEVVEAVEEHEMEEFCRVAFMFQPKDTVLTGASGRFVSINNEDEKEDSDPTSSLNEWDQAAMKNMFGLLTRERKEWHPMPLLCKRCNVRNPYPGSELKGTVAAGTVDPARLKPAPDDDGSMSFGSHITADAIDAPIESFGKKPKSTTTKAAGGAIQFESSGGIAKTEDAAVAAEAAKIKEQSEKKPSMDIFSNIFGDSDSDSDEEKGEEKAPEQPAGSQNNPTPSEQAAPTREGKGDEAPKRQKVSAASGEANAKPADAGRALMAGIFGDDVDDGIEELPPATAAPKETRLEEGDGSTPEADGEAKFVFRKPKFARTKKRQKTASDFM